MGVRSSYLVAVVMALLLAVPVSSAAGLCRPDSLQLAALDARLDGYIRAISRESLQVQKQECDFIIESTTDSLVRNRVANRIYSSYLESPVMGAEAVAVHVFDKWFLTGKASMPGELAFLNARIHADFNRQSLLGCKAPELTMRDVSGEYVCVFPRVTDRFTVLYFYDTDCAKCSIQTILLRNLLDSEDYPVDFYAVYTGGDREEWSRYVSDHLSVDSGLVSSCHLWDPEVDSDFQRKYGVIQTPRLFLIAPDGTITGRGLDVPALRQMLDGLFAEPELVYGGDESEALFDMVFAGTDGASGVTKEDVKAVADHIAASTLHKGDTVLFRQMTGDLLYYLTARRGEAFKEGLDYLIDNHILGADNVWKSQDDSIKVVGMAQVMDDLLSKSVPGSRAADVRVTGTLLSSRGGRVTVRSLRRLGGRRNFIMFFAEGCGICAAEKEVLRRLVAEDRRSRAFLVNMDALLESDPELASRLFDAFDLTSLPFILETDAKGVVVRRYISF